MSAGQSGFPIDSLDKLLRDHERRILQAERRPQGVLWPQDTETALVATNRPDLLDPDSAAYDITNQTVTYQGTTYTLAEWQARP